jgi:hypothetical protein
MNKMRKVPGSMPAYNSEKTMSPKQFIQDLKAGGRGQHRSKNVDV